MRRSSSAGPRPDRVCVKTRALTASAGRGSPYLDESQRLEMEPRLKGAVSSDFSHRLVRKRTDAKQLAALNPCPNSSNTSPGTRKSPRANPEPASYPAG